MSRSRFVSNHIALPASTETGISLGDAPLPRVVEAVGRILPTPIVRGLYQVSESLTPEADS
ncbi:MAG: hypothetical protein WA624_04540, partial [Methylocella sp.]